MPLWEVGDLIVTLSRINSDPRGREPSFAAFDPLTGTLRGVYPLAPPLLNTQVAPTVLTHRDEQELRGHKFNTFPTNPAFPTNSFSTKMSGEPNDLVADPFRASVEAGQDFDASCNLYRGDYNENNDMILRKVEVDTGLETDFIIDFNNPFLHTSGFSITKLRVNREGTIAYWNGDPLQPFNPATDTVLARLDLATGFQLPSFNVRDVYPDADDYWDFDIDRNGNLYVLFDDNITGVINHIAMLAPDGSLTRDFYMPLPGICGVGLLAVNDAILEVDRIIAGATDLEVIILTDTFGNVLRNIPYVAETGFDLYWGMTFAREGCGIVPPVVSDFFFPMVTLIGAN